MTRKWVLKLLPLTALVATTAIAAPVWVRNGDETDVRGRVTEVESTPATGTTQVVIENRDRVTVTPTAQVAMVDVRPGDVVEARYVEVSGQKIVLSMYNVVNEIQAP